MNLPADLKALHASVYRESPKVGPLTIQLFRRMFAHKDWADCSESVLIDPFVLYAAGVPISQVSRADALVSHFYVFPLLRSSYEGMMQALEDGGVLGTRPIEVRLGAESLSARVPEARRELKFIRDCPSFDRLDFLQEATTGQQEMYLQEVMLTETRSSILEEMEIIRDIRRRRRPGHRRARAEKKYDDSFDNILALYAEIESLEGRSDDALEERIWREAETIMPMPSAIVASTLPHRLLPFWYKFLRGKFKRKAMAEFCSVFYLESLGIRIIREYIQREEIEPVWGLNDDVASELSASAAVLREDVRRAYKKKSAKGIRYYDYWKDFK